MSFLVTGIIGATVVLTGAVALAFLKHRASVVRSLMMTVSEDLDRLKTGSEVHFQVQELRAVARLKKTRLRVEFPAVRARQSALARTEVQREILRAGAALIQVDLEGALAVELEVKRRDQHTAQLTRALQLAFNIAHVIGPRLERLPGGSHARSGAPLGVKGV